MSDVIDEMRTHPRSGIGIVLHSFIVLTGGEKLPSQTHLNSLPCLYDFPVFAFISCPFFLIFFSPAMKLFD